MDYLFLVSRILFGGYFAMSGWTHLMHRQMMAQYAASKGVPMPLAGVVVSGLMILLGGLGILLGVYVPWSVALIAAFLIIVTPKMHNYWADTDPNMKMANRINFMKNLGLLGASLAYLFVPMPWMWSLWS